MKGTIRIMKSHAERSFLRNFTFFISTFFSYFGTFKRTEAARVEVILGLCFSRVTSRPSHRNKTNNARGYFAHKLKSARKREPASSTRQPPSEKLTGSFFIPGPCAMQIKTDKPVATELPIGSRVNCAKNVRLFAGSYATTETLGNISAY